MSMLSYEEFEEKFFRNDLQGYPKNSFYIEIDNGIYHKVSGRCNIKALYENYKNGFIKKEKYLNDKLKKMDKKLDDILNRLQSLSSNS